MMVETIVLGKLKTNCYILKNEKNCLVIDPATNFELIQNRIKNYNLLGILITHYHFDHIGALQELRDNYNVPLYDYLGLNRNKVENFRFQIIHNPGHTDDSVSFYFEDEKIMFVGDFIFNKNIGRTDLDTGSFYKMQESLKILKQYDNDIKLYPGHGQSTFLGSEKIDNQFLK